MSYSKKEIKEQIEKGDNEGLGWKDKHYLGAILKMLYNILENKEGSKK